MSAKVESNDFETPDRKRPVATHGSTANSSSGADGLHQDERKDAATTIRTTATIPSTVTPPDSTQREGLKKSRSRSASPYIAADANDGIGLPLSEKLDNAAAPASSTSAEQDGKQVRFDAVQIKNEESEPRSSLSPAANAATTKIATTSTPTSTPNQRGVVSRRGGRLASSPGRIAPRPSASITPTSGSGSRPISQAETVVEFKTFRSPSRRRDENDTVPSLCSTESSIERKKAAQATAKAGPITEPTEEDKPRSISCDASKADTASPLKSEEVEQPNEGESSTASADSEAERKKLNRAISPAPSQREAGTKSQPPKTPTRSPVSSGRFQVLPSLDDVGLKSPVGLFLSPHPPTPSFHHLGESTSFDRTIDLKEDTSESRAGKRRPFERSPKTRDHDRERFVSTPTDFTMDYGRAPNTAGSFDNSNVLSWLQSPTASGLFSPGGLGSIMNTPRAGISLSDSRTPRTPTVSTSFFFSDVAGLPRNADASPKPDSKRGSSQRGFSSTICISPLASSKTKNGVSQSINTPNDFKDVFASPLGKSRGLSVLGDTPVREVRDKTVSRSGSKDPSLDAVHLAEKDLLEDEDLSVLLQLAANTPKPGGERSVTISTSDGTQVFRSPSGRRSSPNDRDENLPGLQLPVIGGKESQSNAARLSRKTHSRDTGDKGDTFSPPSLSMRSNSSNSRDKEKFKGSGGGAAAAASNSKSAKDSESKRKSSSKAQSAKRTLKKQSVHPGPPPPYPMPPPHYPHPTEMPPYFGHMPPGMPHGGSMRVVVNAPPPARKSSSSPPRPYSHMGPGDYPPPPRHYPHPPMSHYPPPPHVHPHHPYYSHHPHHRPPPHMSIYPNQHPGAPKAKAAKKVTTKPTTSAKQPQQQQQKQHTQQQKLPKRPLPVTSQSKPPASTKKAKKSSTTSKKKNKSPQITDRNEREKAAATIKAVNVASGGKNDRAAALAAAILRGVTMRPSGKWQAQLYFAGKSRYIGVFDTREKAALAYEIAREKLKSEKSSAEGGTLTPKATEAAVNAARKAAFDGVNEKQK